MPLQPDSSLPAEQIRKVVHDFRGPLINVHGFSEELRDAVEALVLIVNSCADQIGGEVQARVSEIVEQDISPSLGFLSTAVNQLDDRLDAFNEQALKASQNDGEN